MSIYTAFSDFCNSIRMVENKKWQSRIAEITKKINKKYYNSDDDHNNRLFVGSVGRHTATNKVSDYDVIYILPWDVHHRFDNYSGNGQSGLLQEVKECIKERYPKTKIRADGQVIDVSFDDGLIEIVPGFENDDGSFQYADTNDGGKWKTTNPRPEKHKCKENDLNTAGTFRDCARMIRVWKNHDGFVFSGLLIDTLIDKFYVNNKHVLENSSYSNYPFILKKVFEFLSKQNRDQQYWYALGSNQQISNHGNNKFIKKAGKVLDKLNDIDFDDESEVLKCFAEIFGYQFKQYVYDAEPQTTENFASTYFSAIDIKGSFDIECIVSQNGFRDHHIEYYLSSRLGTIFKNKHLLFRVTNLDLPIYIDQNNLKYYWKVRNYGAEAESKDDLRGQICEGKSTREEPTSYKSNKHYVECYIVDNGVVIARNRLTVPIGEYEDAK